MIHGLFPQSVLSGIIIQELLPPDSTAISAVHINGLTPPGDLERLVLTPLTRGSVSGPPTMLIQSGRFPAPHLRSAGDSDSLLAGLMQGLTAVHLHGYPEVVLAGSDLQESPVDRFRSGLETTIASLYRQVRQPDLLVERHRRADGSRVALVYLQSRSAGKTVQAVRHWAVQLSPRVTERPWWHSLTAALRLPPAMESPSPAAVAHALTKGYVAVITHDRSDPLVAPTTLDLLFSGPGDVNLLPAFQRAIVAPRILAALFGLIGAASFVAVSSYHHSLIPGPFLVALQSSRANLPFPLVGEILIAAGISDAFQAVAARTGGRRLAVLALVGTFIALMAMMQVGALSGVSGAIIISESTATATLPNAALRRVVRLWRYFLIGAATGLGVYGMTLLLFVMMVYLGEERQCEHPVRLPPVVP